MSTYVIGVGMTRFTKMPERSIEDVAAEAIDLALRDAALDVGELDVVFCGSVFGGLAIGQRIALRVGLSEVPIVNLENACASSGGAMREAQAWIDSESAGTALVVGVEMLTHQRGGLISSDAHGVAERLGLTLPGLYAMRATRYLHDFGASTADIASVAMKNRRNGSLNPAAHFQSEVSVDEILVSPDIASPLTLLQCCPNVDGAAALVLASEPETRRRGIGRAVKVAGWGMVSGNVLDQVGAEPTATERAGRAAYERSGVSPADVDVCEIHEPFTIAEVEHVESLGFCEHGAGARYAASGLSAINGAGVAVNTSGGLIARGHPLGASGAAQVVEVVTQLRGEAGARQRLHAKVGVAHIMGGNIPEIDSNACTVHVFTR